MHVYFQFFFSACLLMVLGLSPFAVAANCPGILQTACKSFQEAEILSGKIDTILSTTCDEVVTRGRCRDQSDESGTSVVDEKSDEVKPANSPTAVTVVAARLTKSGQVPAKSAKNR